MSQPNIFLNLEEIKNIIAKYESIKQQRRNSSNKYYHSTKGDAQKSYYLKNKEKCQRADRESKNKKYQSDPEYRAMILERMRLYRINKKLKKEAEQNAGQQVIEEL